MVVLSQCGAFISLCSLTCGNCIKTCSDLGKKAWDGRRIERHLEEDVAEI